MLTFNITQGGVTRDYRKYIYGQPVKMDSKNDPKLLDFQLVPLDGSFVKPTRGAYVSITTDTYGLWYTGYITNDPELIYLGSKNNAPVWGYVLKATSDEYALNQQPLGIMPPFINTTQGEILRKLVQRLDPNGLFNPASIWDGQKVARYKVDPAKKFSDVVKEFSDSSNYTFWAKNHVLFFQQIDALSSPLTLNGNSKHFTPSNLRIAPSDDRIINDAIVLGDIEPQSLVREYHVSDGFTGRFPLSFAPYGVDSTLLLDDDFSNSAIDTQKWTVNDLPNNYLQVSNGYLNALGGPNDGTYSVHLDSASLIPLEGYLRLTHGEYDFVSASDGVIASIWSQSVNPALTGCVYGIKVNKSGANTVLNPIAGGSVDGGSSLTVNYAHRYIFRTIITSVKEQRLLNDYAYRNADGTIGRFSDGGSSAAVDVQTIITEIDPSTADIIGTTTWNHTVSLSSAQMYAYYVPVVTNDLHLSLTGITVSTPTQAQLSLLAKAANSPFYTGAYQAKVVGPNEIDSFDGQAPVATITDSNNGAVTRSSQLGTPQWNPGAAALTFFKNSINQTTDIPPTGTIIRLVYRRAGASVARVQAAASINAEAAAWGDSGIRSVTRNDLTPRPRNSRECEMAAGAIVNDRSYQHYTGTYTQHSGYEFSTEPTSGTLLKFLNMPASFPSVQAEEISSVRSTLLLAKKELIQHELTFNAPDRVRQLLTEFAKPTDVFTPQDTAEVPQYIEPTGVLGAAPDDVQALELASWTSTQLSFNTNVAAPSGGGFEVRWTDESWGADDAKNLITRTSSQTFNVPRVSRNSIIFVKAYDVRNNLLWSEDLTQAAWTKTQCNVTKTTETNPDGDKGIISTVNFNGGNVVAVVQQATSVAASGKQFAFSVSMKGAAGTSVTVRVSNGTTNVVNTSVPMTGNWMRKTFSGTFGAVSGNITVHLQYQGSPAYSLKVTRASLELRLTETVYCKTNSAVYGANSRFAAVSRVQFPLLAPVVTSASGKIQSPTQALFSFTIPSTDYQDIYRLVIRRLDNTGTNAVETVYDQLWDGFTFKQVNLVGVPGDPNGNPFTQNEWFDISTVNLLGEFDTPVKLHLTVAAPVVTAIAIDQDNNLIEWDWTGQADSFDLQIDSTGTGTFTTNEIDLTGAKGLLDHTLTLGSRLIRDAFDIRIRGVNGFGVGNWLSLHSDGVVPQNVLSAQVSQEGLNVDGHWYSVLNFVWTVPTSDTQFAGINIYVRQTAPGPNGAGQFTSQWKSFLTKRKDVTQWRERLEKTGETVQFAFVSYDNEGFEKRIAVSPQVGGIVLDALDTPPAIPVALNGRGEAKRHFIQWNENTETDIAGYELWSAPETEAALPPGGSWTLIYTTQAAPKTTSGLQTYINSAKPDEGKKYAVRAFDKGQNYSGFTSPLLIRALLDISDGDNLLANGNFQQWDRTDGSVSVATFYTFTGTGTASFQSNAHTGGKYAQQIVAAPGQTARITSSLGKISAGQIYIAGQLIWDSIVDVTAVSEFGWNFYDYAGNLVATCSTGLKGTGFNGQALGEYYVWFIAPQASDSVLSTATGQFSISWLSAVTPVFCSLYSGLNNGSGSTYTRQYGRLALGQAKNAATNAPFGTPISSTVIFTPSTTSVSWSSGTVVMGGSQSSLQTYSVNSGSFSPLTQATTYIAYLDFKTLPTPTVKFTSSLSGLQGDANVFLGAFTTALTTPSAPTLNTTAQTSAPSATYSVKVQTCYALTRDAGSALSAAASVNCSAGQTFIVSPPSTGDALYTHYDVYVGGLLVTPSPIPKSMAYTHNALLSSSNDGTVVAPVGSVGGGGSTGLGDGTTKQTVFRAPSGGM